MKKPLTPTPPRWADQLLEWRLPDRVLEEVQGDLYERFHKWVKVYGEKEARKQYAWDVVGYLWPRVGLPFVLKRNEKIYQRPNYPDMFSNYFKIALRNLLRHKAFSLLNIAGLAIGMASSILIFSWVQDEWSYDRFHTHAAQLYRLNIHINDIQAALSSAPLGPTMKASFPEVDNFVWVTQESHVFSLGDRKFEEKHVFFTDSTFFDLFSFPLLKGDVQTALNRPDGLLLTETAAKKYFGHTEALGKTLRMDNQHTFVVTGIVKAVPHNSHLRFDVLLPLSFQASTNDDIRNNDWDNFNFHTYIRLKETVKPTVPLLKQLGQRTTRIYSQHSGIKADFQLQALADIHLHPRQFSLGEPGNIQYVRVFSVVAVFILLIACINFMNLATARSARRAKEVSLRKVVGAERAQLIAQFLGESVLFSLIAMGVAVCIAYLLLPPFNQLTGKMLSIQWTDTAFVSGLLGIAILTGLLSGSYPALFLSAFQPIRVLKGNLTAGMSRASFLRNGLVVAQFTISIVLMVSTVVVYTQLQFIQHRNLGFDKENLLYVPLKGNLSVSAIKAELSQHLSTSNFSIVNNIPTNLQNGAYSVSWEGKSPQDQTLFTHMAADNHFTDVFRLPLLSGRSFSKDFGTDTVSFVINEAAMKMMGMKPETAVGQPLTLWDKKGTIIGVIKDFHFRPLQHSIAPLIIHSLSDARYVVVKVQPGNVEKTIKTLEQAFVKLNPAYPFSYDFVDQDIAKLYRTEQRMGSIFNTFALLSIFISCLGLFGLAAYVAERRTKEVGIRKVLGASVTSLISLLSKDFLKLVLLANLIAWPLAWYVMNRWLEGFAYHINISWWTFAAAGITALLIALLTVSSQAIKAALTNPVKSLRTE
jgi:putative ABC transport system permease protein